MRVLAALLCLSNALAGPSFGYDSHAGDNNRNNNYGNFNGYNSGYNNGYNNGYRGDNDLYSYSIPEFLKNLQPQIAMEFMKLSMNTSKPIFEVERLQENFARQNGFESQYREYMNTYQRQKTEFFASVKQLVSKLTSFFDKSKNVMDNKSNSYATMQKQIYSLLQQLQHPEQQVILTVLRIYGGSHHLLISLGAYPFGNGVYPGSGGYNPWNGGNQWGNGGYSDPNDPLYPPNPNGGGYVGGNGWQTNWPGYPKGFPDPYPYGGIHGNNGMNPGNAGFNDPYGNFGGHGGFRGGQNNGGSASGSPFTI